jgi:hypothetical protein
MHPLYLFFSHDTSSLSELRLFVFILKTQQPNLVFQYTILIANFIFDVYSLINFLEKKKWPFIMVYFRQFLSILRIKGTIWRGQFKSLFFSHDTSSLSELRLFVFILKTQQPNFQHGKCFYFINYLLNIFCCWWWIQVLRCVVTKYQQSINF